MTRASAHVEIGMRNEKTTTSPMRLPAKSKKVLCVYAGMGKGIPNETGGGRIELCLRSTSSFRAVWEVRAHRCMHMGVLIHAAHAHAHVTI